MFLYSSLEKNFRGWPPYLLKQAKKAVFKQGLESWDDLKYIPSQLREKLKKNCPLEIKAKIDKSQKGKSEKALVILDDGSKIESVLMRHADKRNTVCLSSQVGCPMGCSFCLTGQSGFSRNLSSDEIVAQVLLFQRILKKEKKRVSNIVFMGMGEPMLNYKEVMEAIKIINSSEGLEIAGRHISISTCGIVAGIKKMINEPIQINLALSLHAPNNELRDKIMPVNKKDRLEKLLKTVKEYIEKTKRKVMIEYLLIKDVNDSVEQANQLVDILKKNLGKLFFINLIPYNSTGAFKSPSRYGVEKFKKVLKDNKLEVVQRYHFGGDIKAACGQLASKKKKK